MKYLRGIVLVGAALLGFVQRGGAEEYPLGRGAPGFAFLLGGAFQQTSQGMDAAPALAGRYYFPKRHSETAGPEALSPWSVELGAVLPHIMKGDEDRSVGSNTYHAKVRRYASEHLALQYKWKLRRPVQIVPDLSLGIAFAQFETEVSGLIASGADTLNPHEKVNQSTVGPLARAGLSLLANDWFAFRMEVGYTHFANKVTSLGQAFDMGVSGLGIYPSLQIGIGYLQPGVQKGVTLPNSALPLWVLSALQTEKRSPIIAPPEVQMNTPAGGQNALAGNILFQYKNKSAQKVELMADFNNWQPEPMYRDANHVWITVKDLKAGPYHYVFLINGKREVRDPWNTSFDPSARGKGVSMFVVPEVMP